MRRHSGFGWLELIIGILLVVLGIWALAAPGIALKGMVFAYGLAAVIMGIADIVLFIEVDRYTGLGPVIALVSGILSVMSGIMLLVYPTAGALVLTLLFPIWFIAHCMSRLSHLGYIRLVCGHRVYYFTMIIHIVGLILGFLMLFSPLLTFTSIHYFASAYLILLGIDSMVTAMSPMGTRR